MPNEPESTAGISRSALAAEDEPRTQSADAVALRTQVLDLLRAHADAMRARGITHLGVFGSVARDEAAGRSDVDLLIEVDSEAGFGLFDLLDLKSDLGQALGRPVNVAFASKLRPWGRRTIENDLIGIF